MLPSDSISSFLPSVPLPAIPTPVVRTNTTSENSNQTLSISTIPPNTTSALNKRAGWVKKTAQKTSVINLTQQIATLSLPKDSLSPPTISPRLKGHRDSTFKTNDSSSIHQPSVMIDQVELPEKTRVNSSNSSPPNVQRKAYSKKNLIPAGDSIPIKIENPNITIHYESPKILRRRHTSEVPLVTWNFAFNPLGAIEQKREVLSTVAEKKHIPLRDYKKSPDKSFANPLESIASPPLSGRIVSNKHSEKNSPILKRSEEKSSQKLATKQEIFHNLILKEPETWQGCIYSLESCMPVADFFEYMLQECAYLKDLLINDCSYSRTTTSFIRNHFLPLIEFCVNWEKFNYNTALYPLVKENYAQISSLCLQIPDSDIQRLGKKLLCNVNEKAADTQPLLNNYFSTETAKKVPTKLIESLKSIALKQMPKKESDDLAQKISSDLFMIQHQLFCSMNVAELLNGKWNDQFPCINKSKIIGIFNQLSGFIISCILSMESPEERSRLIQFFLDIAFHSRKKNDFATLSAIIVAFNHGSIHRLKATWTEFHNGTPKYPELYKKYIEKTASEENYKNLRSLMEKAIQTEKPVVPYLGLIMRDLFFTLEGNPAQIDKKYNLNLLRLIQRQIEWVKVVQALPFPGYQYSETGIIGFVAEGSDLDPAKAENNLYKRSKILEPEKEKK